MTESVASEYSHNPSEEKLTQRQSRTGSGSYTHSPYRFPVADFGRFSSYQTQEQQHRDAAAALAATPTDSDAGLSSCLESSCREPQASAFECSSTGDEDLCSATPIPSSIRDSCSSARASRAPPPHSFPQHCSSSLRTAVISAPFGPPHLPTYDSRSPGGYNQQAVTPSFHFPQSHCSCYTNAPCNSPSSFPTPHVFRDSNTAPSPTQQLSAFQDYSCYQHGEPQQEMMFEPALLSVGSPSGDAPYSVTHAELVGQVEYVSFPPLPQMRQDTASAPLYGHATPFSVFFGQIKFEVSCEMMVWLINRLTNGEIWPVHIHPRGAGCFMAYFSDPQHVDVLTSLHNSILFDDQGIWLASTEEERRFLVAYASSIRSQHGADHQPPGQQQQGGGAQPRNIRLPKRPVIIRR